MSIVFGTWTTRMRPSAFSERRIAEYAVSSPPMVISCETFIRSREMTAFSSNWGSLVGLALEMPMYEPPRKWMRLTSAAVSGMVCSMLPCISHSNPSRMPTTSTPSSSARMVAALITLLIPGAGPPPTRMASFFWWLIWRIPFGFLVGGRGGPSDTDAVPQTTNDTGVPAECPGS